MGKIEQIRQAIENADRGISKLTPELLDLPAFNTHAIKHLLNNLGAISTRYLECGLHKAGGFICALHGNDAIGLGVDNWSQFEQNGDSKIIAFENCAKYLDELHYAIRDADCFKLRKEYNNDTFIVSPISDFDFYTYDADHSFESQYKGIANLLPLMADEFILIIDDTEWEAPRIATLKAIEDCKLEILFRQHLFDGIMGGKWHNGVDVFYLKKKDIKNKKLAGVMFIRNGILLDYCFEASINSMKAFCDVVIVCYVESQDGTLDVLKSIPDIVILICTNEQWQAQNGREKLALFQNISIEYAEQQGYEYVFLCQGDEVVHEDSIPYIKQALSLGEEAYYVSRYNMWGSTETMLNVMQNRKPCSTVVSRITRSNFRSVDDGEGIATNTASLDFINLIQIYHVGFIRDNKKHIAKIKEMQGNIFLWTPDERVNLKPEFDWKDWGFTHADLISIPKPLPKYLKSWIENLNK